MERWERSGISVQILCADRREVMGADDDDVLVSKAAIAVVLLGALLGIVGAGIIWGLGGVLLFVGSAMLAFGLSGK
jgi:hypothetical protein